MLKKKKGFTLVELLVVIAILAILASVSVVGYLSFTSKAKLSNDQSAIKMFNDNLQAEFVENQPASASEAISGLKRLGINDGKLHTYSSGYHYAYNLKNNRMVLLNEVDQVVFPESEKNCDINDLWGLYFDNNADGSGLSNYVALTPVTNDDAVNVVVSELPGDTLTFDLNNFFFKSNVSLGDKKIDLKNGGYIESEGNKDKVNSNSDTIIKYDTELDHSSFNEQFANGTVENCIANYIKDKNSFAIKKDFTFKNCLFTAPFDPSGTSITSFNFYGDKDITFENCIFTNLTWAAQLGTSGSMTVENCKFVNCVGAINLQRATAKPIKISGNYFDLLSSSSTGKTTAIMFSPTETSLTNEGAESEFDIGSIEYQLTVSDNTIVNTKSIVRLHSNAYSCNLDRLYKYLKISKPSDNDKIKKLIKDSVNGLLGTMNPAKMHFENNQYLTVTGSKVEPWVSEPTYDEGLTYEDFKALVEQKIADLAAIIR